MFGPFILRLLEIIFSALALIPVIFRDRVVSPWGVWCVFVWVFCILVPLILLVMEARSWHILLAAFLPDWADLCCGLTMLCAAMISSASVIFAFVFVCGSCVVDILCVVFSLVATVVFLFDAVKQKMACPCGYLSRLRGLLRMSEAFIACIVLTAANDYFFNYEWSSRSAAMICSIILFVVCLVATVVIVVLNLLKLLQAWLPFRLGMVEFVFNIGAVLLHLLSITLWIVFGYKRDMYHPYGCEHCAYDDFVTVVFGAVVNLVLYIVDLVLSFKSR